MTLAEAEEAYRLACAEKRRQTERSVAAIEAMHAAYERLWFARMEHAPIQLEIDGIAYRGIVDRASPKRLYLHLQSEAGAQSVTIDYSGRLRQNNTIGAQLISPDMVKAALAVLKADGHVLATQSDKV